MLSQLREIVEQVSKVDNVHQALEVLVKATCEAMDTECCTVYLANEKKQRLELMATQGLTFKGNKIHIHFDEGLVGLVKRTAEPINLAEASKHPDFKYFKQLGEDIFQSFLGTPIIYRKKVLGVLVVQQRLPRQFSKTEESFIVTLAAQLAVLIAHSQSQGLWLLSKKQISMAGIAASSGVAIGEFWWDNTQPSLEHVVPGRCADPEQEMAWLLDAIERALTDFRSMRKNLENEISKEALGVFDLYIHLLNDPMLRKDLKSHIYQGEKADWALKQMVEAYTARFASMSDAYLRERALDVKELGQRLLFFLYYSENKRQEIEKPIILVVRELTASILASIPHDKLLAVVTREGAINSHAAILSRALGVPAVMGIETNFNDLNGKLGIVDGYSGQIFVSPNKQLVAEYRALKTEETELSAMTDSTRLDPVVSQDQVAIDILLNAGLTVESTMAIDKGVDGVGLYRTEIAFLLQQTFPSEDEQTQLYRTVLEAFPKKSVVMRTLDIGGDKPLPYLPIDEENPFLGWRGIRFTLDHPDIFLIQLRAMLKASCATHNLHILFPMISSVQELDDALEVVHQAYQDVSDTHSDLTMPRIGVMLEVPSMIYLLPFIADKIDFVSIGTNDLTQYLLAVDRNNTRVADLYDALHPSVLIALKQILSICQRHQLDVSVCGELAGDPIGALILVGMGFRKLSMNMSNVAKVKYLLRHSHVAELENLADNALMQPYSHTIYSMMSDYFIQHEVTGFIRSGKRKIK